jgi:hypothetical protein
LQQALGNVVHARMNMQALQLAIIEELQSGYRPTYRGHDWSVTQFNDLAAAAHAIEAAFNLMKAVQFPETRDSRLADARLELQQCADQPDSQHHKDDDHHGALDGHQLTSSSSPGGGGTKPFE